MPVLSGGSAVRAAVIVSVPGPPPAADVTLQSRCSVPAHRPCSGTHLQLAPVSISRRRPLTLSAHHMISRVCTTFFIVPLFASHPVLYYHPLIPSLLLLLFPASSHCFFSSFILSVWHFIIFFCILFFHFSIFFLGFSLSLFFTVFLRLSYSFYLPLLHSFSFIR